MDFSLTSEQEQLRDNLRGFLRARNGFLSRTETSRSEPGWDVRLWQALADEVGILGARVPEAVGGSGGGVVDSMVIMEEIGASLLLEPYLETAILAAALVTKVGGFETQLADIAKGEARFAFAWAEPEGRYRLSQAKTHARRDGSGWVLSGFKTMVTAAPWANRLLVTAVTAEDALNPPGLAVFLVEPFAKGVAMTSYRTLDGRRAADLHFDHVSLPAGSLVVQAGAAQGIIEAAVDEAIAALCAEALGVMRSLLEQTLEYTRDRQQFGQPLAGFQALQHQMVDMYRQLELARSAVILATLSLDATPLERARAVSGAKVTVGEALKFVGENAIQLHGGMGMTDELALGHYFRRGVMIEGEFGSSGHHLARFAQLGAGTA